LEAHSLEQGLVDVGDISVERSDTAFAEACEQEFAGLQEIGSEGAIEVKEKILEAGGKVL
jgi:hypothetical protein